MRRILQQTRFPKRFASSHVYAGHCQQKEYLTYAMTVAHALCFTMWKIHGTGSSFTTSQNGTAPHDSNFWDRASLPHTNQSSRGFTLARPVSAPDNLCDAD